MIKIQGRAKGPRLPRNVWVLSWVSLLQDAASDMLYPILPLFLTGTLKAPVIVVGFIEGVADATSAIMKLVSGRLADRRKRKPIVAFGYSLSAVAKPLIGLAQGWPLVLVSRFIDRAGKGIRTSPRDAILAAETTEKNRGAAFGFHRAADSAGAVVGPLLGLLFFEMLNHQLRPLFLIAFIPAAISVSLISLVKDSPATAPAPAAKLDFRTPLPARFWKVVGFLTLFGLVNFSDAFLLLRARHLGFTFQQVIGVYVAFNVVYAAMSYPAGRLSDRSPRRWIFAGGLAVFAIAYVSLGVSTDTRWLWVVIPFYGAFAALTDGVGKAWISDLLPQHKLGTGLGIFHASSGAAALMASIWAGLAWSSTGSIPLMVAGSIAGILAMLLVLFGKRIES